MIDSHANTLTSMSEGEAAALPMVKYPLQHDPSSHTMSDTVTTNATCSQEYDWMVNSLGQSPCVVTSHLFTACGDGCIASADDCIIPAALGPGTNYTNPNDAGFGFDLEYGVCTCTTVWYSTLSACAVCQGRGLAIDPWIVYSAQCDPLYIQKFPNPIPNGTAVPGWAFLPIANGMFDLTRAQALAVLHPAENQAPTVIPAQLSSTMLPTSALPTSTHSSAGTPIPAPTSSNPVTPPKKDLAGIIAGSVIGGIIFFVGLGVLIFCCVRRRRELNRRRDALSTPDPYAVSPTSSAPARQPGKTASTVTRSFGTQNTPSSSSHTVLTAVAGFPSPRSPPAASAKSLSTSPTPGTRATATASPQSLVGRVLSGAIAGLSHAPEQESDSGWREGRPGTLPPPYTAD